jgi:hypothetical protein
MALLLAAIPHRALAQASVPWTFRWGPQRTDLVRFNRVEGLSIGARSQVLIRSALGPLSVAATVRLATAMPEPDARLEVSRETLDRRVAWSVFHELAEVTEGAVDLRLGNSVTALFLGRDEGDYYRRTGTSVSWSPPSSRRRMYLLRAYAEYHQAVETGTAFSFRRAGDDDWTARENLVADEGWEVGGLVRLTPWWGTDPRRPGGGVDMSLRAAVGEAAYVRASVGGRVAIPLPFRLGVGAEVDMGGAWGDPPTQRLWLMGGPHTLRGYGPRAMEGRAFGRGRASLQRYFAFGAVTVFSDLAWAGDVDDAGLDHVLISAGTGLSVLDGLIHLDAAWALRAPRGFRLELYLDVIG